MAGTDSHLPGPPPLTRAGEQAAVAQFGHLLVGPCLGTGGTASVHLAIDTRRAPERIVCLKRLLPAAGVRPEIVQSFQREAQISSLLDHQNLVHGLEFGWVDGQHYLLTERVQGVELKRVMLAAAGRCVVPPVEVVLALADQVLSGLEYLHSLPDPDTGEPMFLVHRDITPTNVMIEASGSVKLIDFGLAAPALLLAEPISRIQGTFAYMAPEALTRAPIDARADLYSVGVLLFEFLTGTRLFRGGQRDREAQVEARRTPPRMTAHRDDVSHAVQHLISRALAFDREDRWRSATHMRSALLSAARAHRVSVAPAALADWIRTQLSLLSNAPEQPPGRERFARGTPELTPNARTADLPQGVSRARSPTLPLGVRMRTVYPPARAAVPLVRAPIQLAAPPALARTRPVWLSVAVASLSASAATLAVALLLLGSRPSVAVPEPKPQAPVATVPPSSISFESAGRSPGSDVPIAIDGAAAAPDRPALVSPGAHRVVLGDPEQPRWSGEVTVATGERVRLLLIGPPPAPPAPRRLSGRDPTSHSAAALYRARVCLDAEGAVVDVVTLDAPERFVSRIRRALRTWRYATPVAEPCFAVEGSVRKIGD